MDVVWENSKFLHAFVCVRQMEGHWHHSTQQVSHHSGDNKQRRHHHFSHGEPFCLQHMHAHTRFRVGS